MDSPRLGSSPVFKAGTQSADDPFEFVLSDESVDRTGDVIRADGWDLRDFRNNPVALFGHDHTKIIGVWENVRIEGKRLVAALRLAQAGTSELVDTVRSLVEQRILKAVSVGMLPVEGSPRDRDDPWGGFEYTKSQLLEASLVAVPANQNSLAIAKALAPNTASILFAEFGTDGGLEKDHPGRSAFEMKTPNLNAARIRAKSLGID